MANPILDQIKLSGTVYDLQDGSALHTLDNTVTSGGTNAVKGEGIYNAITASTAALAETINNQHYQTSGDVQSAITQAISGKADASDVETLSGTVTAHTANTTAHTTQAEKDAWNAKVDASGITGFADAVKYNSTTKYVEFYHNGTGGTKVYEYDASPFLIDGMVQNVEIKDVTISGESVTCLVISFNTDAGKQDINIPISQIFDASNYYTKTEADNAISAATSGKADTSAVTQEISAAVSGKQDTLSAGTGIDITDDVISVTGVPLTVEDNVTSGSSNPVKSSGIYSFVTGETSTKQDALVSGTNIKTVNNETILGSGNISTLTAYVSGSTLVFS